MLSGEETLSSPNDPKIMVKKKGISIWGWLKKKLTLLVGAAKFLPRKTFLFVATPAIKIARLALFWR